MLIIESYKLNREERKPQILKKRWPSKVYLQRGKRRRCAPRYRVMFDIETMLDGFHNYEIIGFKSRALRKWAMKMGAPVLLETKNKITKATSNIVFPVFNAATMQRIIENGQKVIKELQDALASEGMVSPRFDYPSIIGDYKHDPINWSDEKTTRVEKLSMELKNVSLEFMKNRLDRADYVFGCDFGSGDSVSVVMQTPE